jgi:hypothetical protein
VRRRHLRPNQVNRAFLNAWRRSGHPSERLDIAARVGFINGIAENGGSRLPRDYRRDFWDMPPRASGRVLPEQLESPPSGPILINLYEAQPGRANRIYLNLTPSGRLL